MLGLVTELRNPIQQEIQASEYQMETSPSAWPIHELTKRDGLTMQSSARRATRQLESDGSAQIQPACATGWLLLA